MAVPPGSQNQDTERKLHPPPPIRQPAHHDSLVILYSFDQKNLGRRIPLTEGPIRVGRMEDNEIVLPEAAVSRRHARLEKSSEGWVVMDVGSCNGTWVNGVELNGTHAVKSGDQITVGSTIFKYLCDSDAESAFFETLYQLMVMDHLTQVHNRAYFQEIADRELSRAKRHNRPLSLLVLDIDFFGNVNKSYGHLAGDAVLREVAQFARGMLQRDELIARYGGEEFVVLMPEADLDTARALATRLCTGIAALVVTMREVPISVTISIGCATLVATDNGPTDLFERADEYLRAAKLDGRNRVAG